ncbi:rod-binding protein [Chelativorans sp. YIM 93263]|uniref:rod-binding protein n=1 Tax=Chelativorans sp. YIM 93263 TaxID=2906648 RepID=UPI002379FE8C|nr:rod-binding protein [Chelativorans sp. YIM 93263]
MAISPPGDIVMDVLRAADPQEVARAHAKLKAKAGNATFDVPMPTAGRANMRADLPTTAKPSEVFVQFEAMVLQSFLDSMLPKEMGAVYGDGLSGDMWRGMLAEQVGKAMAERGGIAIAQRVLGGHYIEGEEKVPIAGISSGPEHKEAATQASLSTAMIQEIERRTAEKLASNALESKTKNK